MKGIHKKRQSRNIQELDSALDRLMSAYFATCNQLAQSTVQFRHELFEPLSIEVNNVLAVAASTASGIAQTTSDLITSVVTNAVEQTLDALSFMFTGTQREDNGTGTVFTAHTDRNQIKVNEDLAYFLYEFRNAPLLKSCNVRLVITEGGTQVQAA